MLPIQLTGQNVEITDFLHDYVEKKFEKLGPYSDAITNIHVVLHHEDQNKTRNNDDKGKLEQIASARVHTTGSEIYAKGESDDMYKSIDLLVPKLKTQLKKHKDKTNNHN